MGILQLGIWLTNSFSYHDNEGYKTRESLGTMKQPLKGTLAFLDV